MMNKKYKKAVAGLGALVLVGLFQSEHNSGE